MWQKFKQLDGYPKTLDEFRVRTLPGAILSLLSIICITLLFLSELSHYQHPKMEPRLMVDPSVRGKIQINFDIIFPSMKCDLFTVDAIDMNGEPQLNIEANLFKTDLASDGTTSKRTKREYLKGEVDEDENPNIDPELGGGCQVFGYLTANKVAGNFHFAPGKAVHQNNLHYHDTSLLKQFNSSHKILKLSFGKAVPWHQVASRSQLDGVEKIEPPNQSKMFQYFLKVVAVTYDLTARNFQSTHFSVTEREVIVSNRDVKSEDVTFHNHFDHGGLPGVFFTYDLSPVRIGYSPQRKTFVHFLTRVCAIIGGIFTVTGILDSIVFHSLKSLRTKTELGKANN